MHYKLRMTILILLYFVLITFGIGCSKKPVTDQNINTVSTIEQINELEKMAIAPPSMESMQPPETSDETREEFEQ